MRAAIAGIVIVLAAVVSVVGASEEAREPIPPQWKTLSSVELVERVRGLSYNWRYFDFYGSVVDELAARADAATPLLDSVVTLRSRPAIVYEVHLGALARLQDPRTPDVVEPLLFSTDREVASHAARTLARFAPDGVARLLAALPELRSATRVEALRALELTSDERSGEVLRRYLEEGTGDERMAACAALGARRDVKAAPQLRKLLRSRGAHVQSAAIVALGQIRDGESVEPLLKLMAGDAGDGWPVTDRATEALGEIGDRRAVPALVAVLRQAPPHQQKSERARAAAARALGRLDDARALSPLLAVLVHEIENPARNAGGPNLGAPGPPMLLPAVTEALHRLAPLDLDTVAAGLDHANPNVREAVADALARPGEPRVVQLLERAVPERPKADDFPVLRALLHADPDHRRGLRALAALLASQPPGLTDRVTDLWAKAGDEFTPFLVERCEKGSPLERMAAAMALARRNDADGVPAVLTLMENAAENYSGTAQLLDYLVRHDRPAVRAGLRRVAARDEVWGGAYAAAALARLGDELARPILIAALDHRLGYVPRVAGEGLAALGDAASLRALAEFMRKQPDQSDWTWLRRFEPAVVERVVPELLTTVDRRDDARLQPLLEGLVPALEQALGDPRVKVRRNAAFLLGQARVTRSVALLIEALKDEPIAAVAAEALGHLGDPVAIEPLVAYQARAVGNPDVAQWLAMLGEPAVPALLEALREAESPALRQRYLNALELLPDPRACDELTRRVETDGEGIAALAALGDPRTAELLVRIAAHSKGVPSREAYQGVVRIGPAAVPALLAELDRAGDDAPPLVVLALGVIGDRRAVPALRDRCDPTHMSAANVLDALGRIGDPAALPDLVRIVEDGTLDEALRQRAATALAGIDTAAVRAPLEQAAQRASPALRQHIATHLPSIP